MSSLTPSSNTASPADSGEASPRPKRGCRGCLGKVLLLLLILAIPAALLINGPGFRALADWGLGKGLASANLSAEYEIDGTLISGIEIQNFTSSLLPVDPGEVEPTSPPLIEALKIGTIEVRYDCTKLLRGDPFAALQMAKLKDVDAIIALTTSTTPDEEPEEDAESEPADPGADPLAILWKLLGSGYDLENLNLVILQDGVEQLRLEGLFLSLPASVKGESQGELGFSRFKMGEKIEQGATRSPLRATGESLSIGRFEPIEGIALTELTLFKKGDDLLTAGLDAASGSLLARYRRDGSIAVELREGSVDVGVLAEKFGFDNALQSGSVDALDLQFAGNPAKPATWNTHIQVEVTDVAFPGEGIDSAILEANAAGGQLVVTLDAERKGAVAHAEASALIGDVADAAALADVPTSIDLTLEVEAIEKFLPAEGPKITGALSLTAGTRLEARLLSDVTANLTTRSISYEGIVFDSLELKAATKGDQLEVIIDAESKGAVANATAVATTGEAFAPAALADVPASIELTLEVEAIEKLLPENSPEVTGALSLTADAQLAARQLSDINANLTTQSITYEAVDIESLELRLTSPTAENAIAELDLALDGETALNAKGTMGLKKFDYRAEAAGTVLANQRLIRLLASLGFDKALAGSVDLKWNGEGVLKPAEGEPATHQGEATVNALDLRIADGRMVNSAAITASYAPASIGVESLEVLSGDLAISAAGSYRENLILVNSLAIRNGDQQLASGSLEVPFDRAAFADKGTMSFFDQDQPLKVDFQSESLQIAELAALAGAESPVLGTIDASVDIKGTPRQPGGGGSIRATGLKLPSAEDVPPGDLAVEFAFGDERFSASGTFDHPQIETLSIDASMPFAPTRWLAGNSSLQEEPLEASINLPASSLEFVTDYVPAIETIAGSATVDIDIAGTIGQPSATGLAEVSIADLKLSSSSAPSIRDAAIKLRVEERVLFIDQLEALVSGGRVALGGQVSLPADGTGPLFDLKADATDALIVRNSDLSVRADADLTLVGSWSKASLKGEIGISDSRFVKDIDILPLSLPSGDDSDLPEIESRATAKIPPNLDLGLQIEPFKGWDLDVRLITHDPFLVRSNLARVDVASDLRVTGTLAKPIPEGRIQVTEGQLTLPFSKVEIEEAMVDFGQSSGFNGKLSVKALAKVRSYEIYIYAFGPLLNPQHVLTSDPPLPTEDIISLLASGTTRDELAGTSGAVVASKAAQLFFKKLKQDNVDPNDEPGLLQELNDRTVLDIGSTDPRTGEQTVAGTIRLFRKFYLVANVSQENDYRVLLKYIFKFR